MKLMPAQFSFKVKAISVAFGRELFKMFWVPKKGYIAFPFA